MQDIVFEFAGEQMLFDGYLPAFFESWSHKLRNDTKMSPQFNNFFLDGR